MAQGMTDTTFSPDMPVNRGQMAKFITRALDHTNARPAGLSVQAESMSGPEGGSIELAVSLRDDKHQPMPDESVELFTAADRDDAFDDDDGACTDDVTADVGGIKCEIDATDDTTDPDGNLADASVELPDKAGSLVLWAWTGEVGDEFDAGETDSVSLEFSIFKAGENLKVSDDMKAHAENLKFGDSVTFTFQVVDADGDPVADDSVEFTVEVVVDDATMVTRKGDDPSTPSVEGADNEYMASLRSDTETVEMSLETDSAGRATLTFSEDDPDSDVKNQDEITLTMTVTITEGTVTEQDKTTNELLTDQDNAEDGIQGGMVSWADDDSVASNLVLDQSVMYHAASNEGNGVRNTVTATLVDQYGNPQAKKEVNFWSGDANGLGGPAAGPDGEVDDDNPNAGVNTDNGTGDASAPADDRTTNRNGVATKSYYRKAASSGTEVVGAAYVIGCNDALPDSGDNACEETDDINADTDADVENNQGITHYWAAKPTADITDQAEIVVVDTDNNTIVATTESGGVTSVHLITYKTDDRFVVDGGFVKIADFEDELDKSDTITVDYTTEATGTPPAIIPDAVHELTLTNVSSG